MIEAASLDDRIGASAATDHARRWAITTILLFCFTQFGTITLLRYLRFPEEGWMYILPRFAVTIAGIGIALLMFYAQRRVNSQSLLLKAAFAIFIALIASNVHGLINIVAFAQYFAEDDLFDYVVHVINWFWFYVSLSSLFLALNHGAELTESKLQVEKLRTLTTLAQLSALRYQLNPHFLFNALNSITALINERQPDEAERMINRLSDFLRAGLDADPLEQVALAEELAQQRRYLEIEQIRFPNRLAYAFEVDAEVQSALVPSLILQPLVENAIKYGVAPSSGLVTIAIEARKSGDDLRIVVRDDGSVQKPGASGTGIGLHNVRERLASLFGDAASTAASPLATGGYAVTLTLPLRRP